MRSEALKRSQANYQKRIKRIYVVFPFCDVDLYNKMQERAKEEGTTAPTWVKNLIKRELEGH